MQAVLLRNSQSEFGRYKIDTGGEVCHLQATIRHLRTAQMLKQSPQLTVSDSQRRIFRTAYLLQ